MIEKGKWFNAAFDALMVNEGGYSNHPKDPGGKTMWGITEKVARAHGYKGQMSVFPKAEAKKIYKRDYWDAVKADELPPRSAFHVFDAAVNSGPRQAIKMAQQAVGFSGSQVDGIIGPKTLHAINTTPEDEFIGKFDSVRRSFYKSLPSFNTFGRGWMARLDRNMMFGDDVV